MKYRAIFDDVEDVEEKDGNLKPWQINLIVFAAIALIVNLMAVIYVNLCRDIYYWSNADYWDIARKLADGSIGMPVWKAVYQSILNGEFNYVPSLLSALFAKLFGNSRMVFILSLVNCYLIPSYILIYLLAKKLGKAPLITMLTVIFTVPVILYLTFNGFTEMGGFVLCLICFYIYFAIDEKKLSVVSYIGIGIVLSLLILWNSWYLFFSVSFITSMTAYAILFRKRPYMCLITLATAVAFLACFFNGYMFRHLLSAYGESKFEFNIILNLRVITRYLGLVFIIGMIAGSGAMVKNNDSRPIFVWLQILICYVSFTSTKIHGQGHLLMYVPGLVILMILSVKYIKTEKLLLTVIIFALIQSASVFLPRTQPKSTEEIKHISLIPSFSMKARKRDSAYDILALKSKLDSIIPEGQYLGVLAYSDILNSDMLKNAEPSLNLKQYRIGYIANTIPYFDLPEVNLNPLCNANYMLVAYPAQYIRENQKVLRAAVDSFASWSDIAMAYEEMYEYATVIDGTEIKLYHRIRDVSGPELAQFRYKLNNFNN